MKNVLSHWTETKKTEVFDESIPKWIENKNVEYTDDAMAVTTVAESR